MSKPFNIHDWQAKQKLAENKSLQISQEEMEELHKNGKVKLKDGSILSFIKKDDVEEANVTGTGASFQAGSGAGYATPYAFKKKRKKDLNEAPVPVVLISSTLISRSKPLGNSSQSKSKYF